MTPEQIQWIEALRSGRYEQGTIYLEQDNKFCCLGVACDLFAKETRTIEEGLVKYAREAETAPAKVVKILPLWYHKPGPDFTSTSATARTLDGL